MSEAIVARDLVKTYPRVRALDGVSFTVERGSVFGLFGPNGAGKSTAVRILTTLSRPDSGHARVAGFDVLRERRRVHAAIGVVAQKSGADPEATGRENLSLQAPDPRPGRPGAEPAPRRPARALRPSRGGGSPRPRRPVPRDSRRARPSSAPQRVERARLRRRLRGRARLRADRDGRGPAREAPAPRPDPAFARRAGRDRRSVPARRTRRAPQLRARAGREPLGGALRGRRRQLRPARDSRRREARAVAGGPGHTRSGRASPGGRCRSGASLRAPGALDRRQGDGRKPNRRGGRADHNRGLGGSQRVQRAPQLPPHGVTFRILADGGEAPPELTGPKDTVYLPPGESVRLLVRFPRYADPRTPYMFHCHLLQHEDRGMLGQFVVIE